MVVPLDRQKNVKQVTRNGATKLFGVDEAGRAAYRNADEFLTPDALGTKADKMNAVLEGQPTAPTPDTADKSDRLATTRSTWDVMASLTPVERATAEEVAEGVLNDKYVTPAGLKPALDETRIRSMEEKTDVVTYETLTALAESSTDNEKAAIKRVFEAGGTMPFRVKTEAQATAIPATVMRAVIDGVNYKRVAEEPPHALKFRSADRWTDEEAHDSANGGWWEIDEPVVTALMAGAVGDGVSDDTTALNNFFTYAGTGTLSSGKGKRVDAPSGRYLISDTVTIPFGVDLKGPLGSSLYGFRVDIDPVNWSGADVGVLIQAQSESFSAASIGGITVDCKNTPGVEGLRAEGLYQNSRISDIYIRNTANDVHGLHLRPLDRLGAAPVCESIEVENVYVIPADGGVVTKPPILFDRCQECTLTNVKGFGRLPGGSGTSDVAAIKFLDCRGMTMIGGATAFGKHGIEVEASTRAGTGVTMLGVTYEGITDRRLYVHGTPSHKLGYVNDRSPRLEAPFSVTGLFAEYVDFLTVENLFQTAELGEGVTSAILYGYGAVTAAASARFVKIAAPNAVDNFLKIGGTSLVVSRDNSPSVELEVPGRTGRWRLGWSASQSVDNGARVTGPQGTVVMQFGETAGTGAGRLGFFGAQHIERRTVTGSRGGNVALASLLTQLAAYGLIVDNSTA